MISIIVDVGLFAIPPKEHFETQQKKHSEKVTAESSFQVEAECPRPQVSWKNSFKIHSIRKRKRKHFDDDNRKNLFLYPNLVPCERLDLL
jgi:hypothetical protein